MEVLDETNRFPHVDALERITSRLLEELGLDDRELTVVLQDDQAIRRLNREHRGVDEPTDVLSYPTAEPDDVGVPGVPHLGDIIISIDTAARQAVEHGHDLLGETLVLTAHGLTHLRGFDHTTEEEWNIFRATQQRILTLSAAP
ncbi:MAG TPA: rRNA maturation RNase YbeY [Trueperaceae bacterium]